MHITDFSKDWWFTYAEREDWCDSSIQKNRTPITLPHDFRIGLERSPQTAAGASEGFYPGGIGYYQKNFTVNREIAAGRVLLDFDGIYRMSEVRLNGSLITLHAGGYSPFLADLTGRLREGENLLQVKVNASQLPASRWYSGAGIYRGIRMLTAPIPCFEPWGISAVTESLSSLSANIRIRAELYNPLKTACRIAHAIYDEHEDLVAEAESIGEDRTVMTLSVLSPMLWDVDHPRLYSLYSTLKTESGLTTSISTRFGIRTVAVDVENGFLLNGVPLLLKGGCVHHDNGLLGARSFPASERRKVQKLKENGFNAIRCAHNPPSSAFLDACDELGMLVIDEAFDCWREGKKLNDEHLFFESEWRNELSAMIRRDRNHPSVIMWSTGNEIVERSGISDGAIWSRRLAEAIRVLDSTRPVTNALCGFSEDPQITGLDANTISTCGVGKDYWAAQSEEFCMPLDVVGYNYLLERYDMDHKRYPKRILMGTESFPLKALENWQAVIYYPHVIGDFVWTAWEYLGESGIGHTHIGEQAKGLREFPWHLANCGDLDLCGRKRPQSHFRDFIWNGRKEPYLAVQYPGNFGCTENISPWGWPDLLESWTFPDYRGHDIKVTVYAGGDEAALYLNGELLEKKPCGMDTRYTAEFYTVYSPGELMTVAYEKGREVGRQSLKTAGAPSKLELYPEKETIEVDGLVFLEIIVEDREGNPVPYAQNAISVSVTGGVLLAMGSGNPADNQNYTQSYGCAWHGRTMVVIQPDIGKTGVSVVAASAGIKQGSVWIPISIPIGKIDSTARDRIAVK